jgi:hypothetical protein
MIRPIIGTIIENVPRMSAATELLSGEREDTDTLIGNVFSLSIPS